MESKVCLGCRFSTIKVDVLVPEKYNLKGFTKETQKFAAGITAITRRKPLHYELTFDSKHQERSALDFRVNCSCILNVETNDCSRFNPHPNCKIKHFQQNKPSQRGKRIEIIKIKH